MTDGRAFTHPSPRNHRWLRRNPWFEAELLPRVRERVADLLADGGSGRATTER